jgi:hypothetical protein
MVQLCCIENIRWKGSNAVIFNDHSFQCRHRRYKAWQLSSELIVGQDTNEMRYS